jgi:uncharacterized repeat protein (TIGR03803 family)
MSKNNLFDFLSFLVLLGGSLMPAAKAQTFTVLYNFGSVLDDPVHGALTMSQGVDGDIYTGSAEGGQDYQQGAVFKMTTGGQLTLLYSFSYVQGSGAGSSGLTLGTDGDFYGVTPTGGNSGDGTAYKITASGSLSKLYDFTGGSDGWDPNSAPVQSIGGSWFGTVFAGGANEGGTVYKITPSGVFSTIHAFGYSGGSQPNGPLVQGTDGNFYGTTAGGGAFGNLGTVFKIAPSGALTTLYSFDGTHGLSPQASLIQGTDGNFYGTASLGGKSNDGVIFKITPTGKLSVLYNFCPVHGCADGFYPASSLVQATDGNFYGVSYYGGNGYGTIYKLTPAGQFSVDYSFDGTTASEHMTIIQHTDGLLYGTTSGGGTGSNAACQPSCGTFYSFDLGLPPFVKFLPQRSTGKAGAVIGIFGQGFTGTTAVAFGGTRARFAVESDTYLNATVPVGAATGFVTVTTASGTLSSMVKFRVTQ